MDFHLNKLEYYVWKLIEIIRQVIDILLLYQKILLI